MMSIQLSFQINGFPERLKSVSITAAVAVAMAVMAEPGKTWPSYSGWFNDNSSPW